MKKTKILVVDDEKIFAMDIEETLTNLGYEVVETLSSGKDAIKQVAILHPDLVMMDIMLHGEMDGIEAAEEIRKRFDIPVLFLTAYADEKTFGRAKITDPYGYVIKPVEEREIHIAIELAVNKHNMERSLKDREKWLDTTLKSITDSVIATDPKGFVQFINPAAEELTGWKEEDTIGKETKNLFNLLTTEDDELVGDLVENILRDHAVVTPETEYILVNREGKRCPVIGGVTPIINENKKVLGAVLTLKDVSSQKRFDLEIKNTLMQLAIALSRSLELRDPYTSGHGVAVSKIAGRIATKMGWNKDRILGIELTGLVHDIGKIGIPSQILTKPRKLSKSEWEMIEGHPRDGYKILKDVPFPFPLAEAVYQHHEKLDGSGYPRGLKKNEIIDEAKILTISDVLDAMTAERPYRVSHYSVEEVLGYLNESKGKLYDERMVEIILRVLEEDDYRPFWKDDN